MAKNFSYRPLPVILRALAPVRIRTPVHYSLLPIERLFEYVRFLHILTRAARSPDFARKPKTQNCTENSGAYKAALRRLPPLPCSGERRSPRKNPPGKTGRVPCYSDRDRSGEQCSPCSPCHFDRGRRPRGEIRNPAARCPLPVAYAIARFRAICARSYRVSVLAWASENVSPAKL